MTCKLNSPGDVMDLLQSSLGHAGLVLTEAELGETFFDLSSGLAGELMQKFTNYERRLALVVPDPGLYSDRFQDLVREHRAHSSIRFFGNVEQARDWIDS